MNQSVMEPPALGFRLTPEWATNARDLIQRAVQISASHPPLVSVQPMMSPVGQSHYLDLVNDRVRQRPTGARLCESCLRPVSAFERTCNACWAAEQRTIELRMAIMNPPALRRARDRRPLELPEWAGAGMRLMRGMEWECCGETYSGIADTCRRCNRAREG